MTWSMPAEDRSRIEAIQAGLEARRRIAETCARQIETSALVDTLDSAEPKGLKWEALILRGPRARLAELEALCRAGRLVLAGAAPEEVDAALNDVRNARCALEGVLLELGVKERTH